jgi:hypothetical protein
MAEEQSRSTVLPVSPWLVG